LVRAITNTDKRYVQSVTFPIAGASTENIVIVDAKQDPNISASNDVKAGTVVTAVYLEYWILANSQQPAQIMLALEKVPADSGGIQFADNQLLTFYKNKKNIFYTTQGLVGDANTNPTPFVRQWFKIPKGKQRFGNGDRLNVSITSILTEDVNVCGFGLFKAQT